MNIRFLETFLTVVEEKSFSTAAKRLHLTQPAVTKHIQGLERYFDVTLFERKGWRSEPTEAGERLVVYARRIVSTLQEAERDLKKLGDEVRGILRIGASTIPGEYVVPLLVGEFATRYPDVHLQLEIADSGRIQELILQRDLDLGLIGYNSGHPHLEYFPFAEDELILVIPADHPWAGRASITIKELEQLPMVWREKESGTRQAIEKILQEHKVDLSRLQMRMELGSTEAVLNAVVSGKFATIVSQNAAQRYLRLKQLVSMPIEGVSLKRPLYVVHRKEKNLSLVVETFVSYIREKAAQQMA
ncbi:MAG: LysR family transcriptional regulator [Firmicutes bacterium]|nr:LysR family transcriptional regulator [Bacillota bacterium]